MSEPTYTTFALDDSGDWEIPVRLLTGREATKQWLTNRFRSFLGDWFLDLRRGIPYREVVFVKDPNPQVIRGVFRQVLATTPGVLRVTRFDMSADFKTRELLIGPFEAVLTGDRIFRAQPHELIVRFP